jgi:hypothetical protein
MQLLEDGKAGKIIIRAMETTNKNGTYKIFYEQPESTISTHSQGHHHGHSGQG